MLSLNEFYLAVANLAFGRPLSGEEFWRILAEPHPIFDAMVRAALGCRSSSIPAYREPGSMQIPGIPAISMMTLPHLSPDPDGVFDALARAGPDVAATNPSHALREALQLARSTFRWDCRGGAVGHVSRQCAVAARNVP